MALEIGHPIKRDGTSQRQRPISALLPENNPIDPRSVEEGLVYAYRLAEKVNYLTVNSAGSQLIEFGNWQAFFPGEDSDVIRSLLRERPQQEDRTVPPQQALFITFLKLLDLLRKDLNTLTQRHLAFYYEEVLGFERRAAKADQVHTLFELAKQKSRERIETGTKLLAGKDADKKPLYYRIKHELVVSSAKVKMIRSAKGDAPDPTTGTLHTVPADKPFAPFGDGGGNQTSNLLIGLENLPADSQLNLLFQVVEGTALLEAGLVPEDIQWGFRKDNNWSDLAVGQLVRDTTLGLQRPGIVTISFSGTQQPDADTEGIYWIRAKITKNADNSPRMRDVQAQAAIAEFEDSGNASSHLEGNLAPEKIKNLERRNVDIRKVRQPYPSFGGSPKEKDHSFFARVSERLRHKQRAVTIWDYEHLVLSAFEQIYKVKAISHTQRMNSGDYSEFRPGRVEIVIIPIIRDVNMGNVLGPKASNALREEIRRYLLRYCSQTAGLGVSNPTYETLQLDFEVGFREGFDGGFYRGELNEVIKRYLSPWAFEEGADISFGGQIYRSQLLAFIEGLEYVDYVTNFKLIHTYVDPANGNPVGEEVPIAEASTAASILVSAEAHHIRALAPEEFPCDESDLCEDGIGCMIVTLDFIVGKP